MSVQMATSVPAGACPKCSNMQFLIYEQIENAYMTNRHGEIIDSCEFTNRAVGMCMKCGYMCEMMSTPEKFIPLSPLRKILYDYSPHKIEPMLAKQIPNPMEKKGE